MDLSREVHSRANIKEKEIYCITEFSVSLILLFGSVFDANIHVVPGAEVEKEHNMIPNKPPAFWAWALQSLTLLCLSYEP